MKLKSRVGAVSVLVLASCVACAGIASSAPIPITSPKEGWVTVTQGYRDYLRPGDNGATFVQKTCDGTTLLYYAFSLQGGSGGVAALPNSPECAS